nr:hypothetical protein [Tanacetum cinerariifolium]
MCELACQIIQKKQEEKRIEEEQAANARYWKIPTCCDDDDDYDFAITPVLSSEETNKSLNLQIINEELAEYINSSSWNYPTFYDDDDDEYSIQEFVGELVYIDPIPPRIDETDYDPKDGILFIEQLLYNDTLSEDDSFEDIDYAEASPPDFELVSLGEVKDEILRAKLLNIHLLIAKIESLNNNPTPDCVLKSPSSSFISYTDNSSPEFETFSDHTEETSSGSNTTHANNSLLEYDSFLFEVEPDQGELDSVVMNNIPDNLTNDPLMEVVDLFLASENSIPPEIENVDYDSEGDILFLNNCLEMIPLPFPSLNHLILIFRMIHYILVLWKNHQMMVAF